MEISSREIYRRDHEGDYHCTREQVKAMLCDQTEQYYHLNLRKTSDNTEKIRKYLEENEESKTSDIADYLDLSPARTRVILNLMDYVEAMGGNSNRKYKLR